MYNMIWLCSRVQYDLALLLCTIRSGDVLVYDINLRATHTTILSLRGVTIHIYLVSSATDSIRRRVVLFKPVPVPTSDPKSEFLCQSSLSCAEPADPLNTSYAWDISHALVTMYHPYCHSPSALTEYLKQRLRHQRAKCLGRSPSAQVEQNVTLERNTFVYPHHFISIPAVSALLVAYSPVHPGAFVHATEHMISIIAGPDKTGSITHPDSAQCFLLHKWIQARALDQATQCIAPRLDCHTVRTFLMMQAHPQAP